MLDWLCIITLFIQTIILHKYIFYAANTIKEEKNVKKYTYLAQMYLKICDDKLKSEIDFLNLIDY